MNTLHIRKSICTIAASIGVLGLVAAPVSALTTDRAGTTAATTTPTTATTTPKTTASSAATAATNANEQAHVKLIIARGNAEIARRITALNAMTTIVNATKKLTGAEKADLNSIVSTNIASLNTQKAKLDADVSISDPATALATARTDAQAIILSYRIYVLILPQINLIKTADDQQVTEANLTTLAGKLATRISAAQTAGKDVTALQASLSDLNAKNTAAQGISSKLEANIVGLTPANYNDNHTVLSSYRDQLVTAHADIVSAVSDAKTIITGLESV